MTEFIENIDLLDCLIGAAALALILLLVRRKSSSQALKKDKSGLYKYHDDTQIKPKKALNPTSKKGIKKVAVIDFEGDTKASSRSTLSKLVDEISVNKKELAEVVVIVSSPGGMVPHYGHAFAEMERLRALEVPLTVCVNVVAASGGYLMSLPAHKIIAAPFSLVGSVGVVAFIPNIRELLTSWKVTPRTFTAGTHKRTVTLTDDGDPEREKHLKSQLETIHRLFLDVVEKYRPSAKIDVISTGDNWTAAESVERELGLVDEIGTSSQYLFDKNQQAELMFFASTPKKKGLMGLLDKLMGEVSGGLAFK